MMAKVSEAQTSIKNRLRALFKSDDRHEYLNAHRRPSAVAMRAAAFRYYPEERLRTLHRTVTEAVDGGVLPGLIRKIQRDIIGSPNYSGFAPPSKLGGLFMLDGFRALDEPARADMARFQTHTHEIYTLAVLLATEDSAQADAFGDCDDPDGALREMDDLRAQRPALVEGCRTATGPDVMFREELLADGRRVQNAYYAITSGEVRLGDTDALVAWARQHQHELGVS